MGPVPTKITRNNNVSKLPTKEEIDSARKKGELFSLLLIGSGESGKTTILRQMLLLHGSGISEAAKQMARPSILFNLLEGAFAILQEMRAKNRPCAFPELEELLLTLYKVFQGRIDLQLEFEQKYCDAILTLIDKDDNFLKTYHERDSLLLQDSWFTLAMNLKKFPVWGGPAWLPSDEDMILSRIRSIGVTTNYFKIGRVLYEITDIGGQKSERKKFFDLFRNMKAVLFVCSLAEYNLKMFESPTESRLEDSLNLFRSVATSPVFESSALLLFLNKKDVFLEKYYQDKIEIQISEELKAQNAAFGFTTPIPIREKEANADCEVALDWFRNMYLSRVPAARRPSVFTHFTTATSTDFMREAIEDVSQYILTEVLGRFGMMMNV